ncbi:nitrite reductase, copper-containing [Shinella daejeonensis]|uniref:copper-containing nitrite reductase n=1 Tax=Shinella daejeonensis TaxID=659017 RepID=UPI0020C83252|nr:copper-containing nitrite reductase [Shinella daejeonensis]MCP8894427.1 nitrite reductase, copper-containing [Shinella daejeonensis]
MNCKRTTIPTADPESGSQTVRATTKARQRPPTRFLAAILGLFACLFLSPAIAQTHDHGAADETPAMEAPAPAAGREAASSPAVSHQSATVFTFRTGIATGRMVYIGVGGDIDGQVNPTLMVHEGELVQINLINGEGAEHDVVIDQYAARSSIVIGKNASSTFSFVANKVGEFAYFCSIAGHRAAGMEGLIQVMPGPRETMDMDVADIVRDPADLPGPIGQRQPQTVRIDMETIELEGRLDDGTTYVYWTFDRKVPGPFIRVRVGDMVEVHLKNAADSVMMHSVDFHAATGPGGGADFTQIAPGEEAVVSFRALKPGIYVYHCATPSVTHHITSGMYGLILVEPEGGLPQVDREFYVMQGELYTVEPFGTKGEMEMDYDKLLSENPEYFLFNGSVGALTKSHPLYANAGETVRIYFGVGGPNFTSSFHVIGEIFDHAYAMGSVTSPPLTNVQTVTVPPGGATIVDFKIDRGGHYVLVDHALSRAERGLAGYLIVDGPENDGIMHSGPVENDGQQN